MSGQFTNSDPDIAMRTTMLLDEAKLAFDRQDYKAAISAADRIILSDKRSAKAWRLKLASLRKAGDAALAETIALEAMAAFPNVDWPVGEHAHAAAARGDFEEAMNRFSELRKRFAGSATGYVGAVRLALSNSKPAIAQALLAEGVKRFPDNKQLARLGRNTPPTVKLAVETESTASRQRDAKTALAEIVKIGKRESRRKVNKLLALSMFDALHGDHPDYAPAYAAHIDLLLQMDRAAEAVSFARVANTRFPEHLAVGLATVRALGAAGEIEAAESLASHLNNVFPDTPALHSVRIHVLTNAGRESEAEALAEQAVATWPKEPGLWREYARIATRQGDWAAALNRWLEAQRQRPEDPRIARQVELAQAQLCVAPTHVEASSSIYELFESLGGEAPGCEFGMVQRQGGSISVGLLRWAAITPEKLIEALDSDLEGFGSEAQTKLIEVTEYYGLRDTRYDLFTHTFVKRADAPFDKMLVQSCRRMRFLADKLREQLRAAEKVFVYKSIAVMQDSRLFLLHDAIQRRGGQALLCLQIATGEHKPGSVRIVRPNLFMGYVEFFLNGEPSSDGGRFDTASYNNICARVSALVSSLPRPVGLVDAASP